MNSDEIKVARSRLCNEYAQQIKALEKDLKKKKGPAADEIREKLENLEEEQKNALLKFDTEHNLETKATKAAEKDAKEKKKSTKKVKDFRAQDWGSLSNTELAEICEDLGLSKKGKKQDLVARLQIFTAEQQGTFEDNGEESSEDETKPKKKAPIMAKVVYADDDTLQAAGGPKNRDRSRNKVNHRNKAATIDAEEEERRTIERNERLAKLAAGDGDVDSSEDEDDRKARLADLYRKMEEEEKPKPTLDDFPAGGSKASTDVEERAKQVAREQAMEKVLTKMVSKFEKVKLSDFPATLAKLKVANWNPERLGYGSDEEYIMAQPKSLFLYDRNRQTIWAPGSFPEYSDEE